MHPIKPTNLKADGATLLNFLQRLIPNATSSHRHDVKLPIVSLKVAAKTLNTLRPMRLSNLHGHNNVVAHLTKENEQNTISYSGVNDANSNSGHLLHTQRIKYGCCIWTHLMSVVSSTCGY